MYVPYLCSRRALLLGDDDVVGDGVDHALDIGHVDRVLPVTATTPATNIVSR